MQVEGGFAIDEEVLSACEGGAVGAGAVDFVFGNLVSVNTNLYGVFEVESELVLDFGRMLTTG